MIIISSAPGKLILMGEHASSRGKPALVFAVNKRLFCTLKTTKQHKILLTSKNFNVIREEYPSTKLDIVSSTISAFFEKVSYSIKPFELEIESEITPGFGSSAAVIVSVLGVLNEYFQSNLSMLELLKLGIEINQTIKGYGSGLDIATAVLGGLIKYQTDKKPITLPIQGLNFIVGNTGIKAPSGPIVAEVRDFEAKNQLEANRIFNRIRDIVSFAEDAILSSDYIKLGLLMNENHTLLQELNVSSPLLDEMVSSAKLAGAYGAKLSGAGRGDNMLALVPESKISYVTNALNSTSGSVISNIVIDKNGLLINRFE
ncbi:MAG: mevalonate kinase [Asgard group archaeon]|nr:mevalonate kinase [Asgard group archaeon]